MTGRFLPYVMGGLMGPMMLWMLHDTLMSGAKLSAAAIGFALAHLIVAAALILVVMLGARLHPRIAHMLQRLHKPRAAHIAKMLASAALAALVVHIVVHVGGQPWT